MRRAAPILLALLAAAAAAPSAAWALPGGCEQSAQTVTCRYAGGASAVSGEFTVPAGVSAIGVQGAGGAGAGSGPAQCDPLCGGSADLVAGTLPVTPGQRLEYEVAAYGSTSGAGGAPGGGSGCNGGGGYTVVDGASGAPWLVAAGGGGDGCAGTNGGTCAYPQNDPATQGGDAGAPGAADTQPRDGGGGGAATASAAGQGGGAGSAGTNTGGGSGQGLAGGAGGDGPIPTSGGGGGGGGGLFGGGGGGGGATVQIFCVFTSTNQPWAGSGGGGGGGSSLVPAAGSSALTAIAPFVQFSYDVISFTSPAPPSGTIGRAYSYTYAATGDTSVSYEVTAGALPPGLSLSAAGALSGTPTSAGNFTYTVSAIGATASAARQDTIVVVPAVEPTQFVWVQTQHALVRGGAIRLVVRCTGGAPGGFCSGAIRLTVRERIVRRVHRRRRTIVRIVVLATGSCDFPTGSSQTVLVHFGRGALRLLAAARGHHLRALARVNLADGSTGGSSVTVALGHRAGRRHRRGTGRGSR